MRVPPLLRVRDRLFHEVEEQYRVAVNRSDAGRDIGVDGDFTLFPMDDPFIVTRIVCQAIGRPLLGLMDHVRQPGSVAEGLQHLVEDRLIVRKLREFFAHILRR